MARAAADVAAWELAPSRCVLCAASARALLCPTHAAAIERHPITPEQMSATCEVAVASLIGPHDVVLAVGEDVIVGRDPRACDVALLDATLSPTHARLERNDLGWLLTDLGSRFGTRLDGYPIERAVLPPRALLCFGDVELYFVGTPLAPRRRRARRSTWPGSDPGAARGGALQVNGARVEFTAREFGLLELLATRRSSAPTDDLAYVSAETIAEWLGFRSSDTSGENVRELVRRVRVKLITSGARYRIETRRGAGYRITAAPHDP
jgi:hypothetical protein